MLLSLLDASSSQEGVENSIIFPELLKKSSLWFLAQSIRRAQRITGWEQLEAAPDKAEGGSGTRQRRRMMRLRLAWCKNKGARMATATATATVTVTVTVTVTEDRAKTRARNSPLWRTGRLRQDEREWTGLGKDR